MLFNTQETLKDFLTGKGVNHKGLSIQDILDFDNDRLESEHDYIQWLFPTIERSKSHPLSPVVKDIGYFFSDYSEGLYIHGYMNKSFNKMLIFYGFSVIGNDIVFNENLNHNWITKHNHNYLRITRILKSLRLFGLDNEAVRFYRALTSLEPKYKEIIGEKSYKYWYDAIHN